MAKSRKNPKRKKQLNNFKQKHKRMSQNAQQSLPLVRNVPVWDNDVDISVKGFEWEAIQNGLVSLQLAQQASQSVMSRNIVEGKIDMKFEKLNPITVTYEPMTDEEAKKYKDEWRKLVEAFKQQQAGAANGASPIVNEAGEQIPKSTDTAEVAEKPKRKPRAKVVKMEPKTQA